MPSNPLKMISTVKQTAYMYFAFNLVRFLSILTILLVFSSNILIMYQDIQAIKANNASSSTSSPSGSSNSTTSLNVTSMYETEEIDCDYLEYSTVPNQPAGAFWAILNRLFILFQCLVLLWSELGFQDWILKEYIPVLGPDYGVGILGAMQCMIGAAVLSHHVDEFPLVSAFFLFSVGCLNIIFGVIFRAAQKEERRLFGFASKTRKTLSDGGYLPKSTQDGDSSLRWSSPVKQPGFLKGLTISRPMPQSDAANGPHMSWGFGRQGQKAAAIRGSLVSEPDATLPRFAPPPMPGSPDSGSQKAAISAPWPYKTDDNKF